MARADAAAIEDAAAVLRAGGLAAFPTETVYGLGTRADDPRAVASLYAAKGRPSFNPLIAHVRNLDAAKRLGNFSKAALVIAEKFWPGPLTLVVKVSGNESVCELARAGLDTIAIRVPSHEIAQALLTRVDFPIVAPSANRSGHVSPTTAQHVAEDLSGKIDLILDGGASKGGIESTIVDFSGDVPRLLRSGGIARVAIEKITGPLLHADKSEISAPGMMASHYAPNAKIRLDAKEVRENEALLAFGASRPEGTDRAREILNLSERGDLTEAASNLYAYLRALDASGVEAIAVASIPREGLGEAILDRLQRAAAPK
ncbi:MAG: threonylcarbamoyl-AMP synthase [Xanthobacteraceae bacterium]|nr:threonylcarbamoyl-AMP synthase [Xanthobacteraceae bacterium]